MHIDITFMELVALAAMLLGAAWALLKMNARQFSKGLDERFEAVLMVMKTRADEQDKKLEHIDSMASKMQVLEVDSLKRHAEYLKEFCTKTELGIVSTKQDRTLEGIFALLREISDKLSNKVSREECRTCRGESNGQ